MPKKWSITGVVLSLLLVLACSTANNNVASDNADSKKEPAAPPSPVSAKTAFWPMYTSARDWAKDFVVLRLTPKEIPGYKNEGGKAAMWEVTFASPSRQEYRTYSYAIAAYPPDIYKGVSIGRVMPWNGVTRDVMPIQVSEFATDSDAAYNAAAADAAAWLKKHPEQKVSELQLENVYTFQVPVWYVMWGDKKLGYRAFVNAVNGRVLPHK